MSQQSQKSQILEGSRAIALTIKNIRPAVVSAYPITPQTHIVEDLAKFKADGQADYEYVRAESEFAAASIILGASATGARTYSATSSQGLLLMAEVIYNIAGIRLPVVITCANRAVSAPINIWNDQQDVMAIRDAGWLLFFAENHQEAVNQHIMAYKISERLKIPAMLNVDGFIITHTYEPVIIPTAEQIKKYLPDYRPTPGAFLDPANPVTLGHLATPAHYLEIRQKLHDDLTASLKTIEQEYKKYNSLIGNWKLEIGNLGKNLENKIDNGLIEYTGPKSPRTVLVAMGSVIGTIKNAVTSAEISGVGVLKLKVFRPFPAEQILKILRPAENIAVIDKAISLGHLGPLAADIKAACQGKISANISSFVVGLGGRDITKEMVIKIVKQAGKKSNETIFIGK
jgi:pyruvate ferredoxin oxidoreductase alpha subunit